MLRYSTLFFVRMFSFSRWNCDFIDLSKCHIRGRSAGIFLEDSKNSYIAQSGSKWKIRKFLLQSWEAYTSNW